MPALDVSGSLEARSSSGAVRLEANGDRVSIRFDHFRDAWSWLQAGRPPGASPRSTRARLAGLGAYLRRNGLRLDVRLNENRLASLGHGVRPRALSRIAGLEHVEIHVPTLLRGFLSRAPEGARDE